MKKETWLGNKSRLVWKGYTQVEGIDFDETFTPIVRLDSIRMFLDFACYKKIKVYQMDVNSTFLNGNLEEEVYIEHPWGFLLGDDENQVCMLKRALYGLKKLQGNGMKRYTNIYNNNDSKRDPQTTIYISNLKVIIF